MARHRSGDAHGREPVVEKARQRGQRGRGTGRASALPRALRSALTLRRVVATAADPRHRTAFTDWLACAVAGRHERAAAAARAAAQPVRRAGRASRRRGALVPPGDCAGQPVGEGSAVARVGGGGDHSPQRNCDAERRARGQSRQTLARTPLPSALSVWLPYDRRARARHLIGDQPRGVLRDLALAARAAAALRDGGPGPVAACGVGAGRRRLPETSSSDYPSAMSASVPTHSRIARGSP